MAMTQHLELPITGMTCASCAARVEKRLNTLDGVHATTITYAILAQEFINVMVNAGVVFNQVDGQTPRPNPINIDFAAMIRRDSLVGDPPQSLSSDLSWAAWFNELLDWVTRLGRVL